MEIEAVCENDSLIQSLIEFEFQWLKFENTIISFKVIKEYAKFLG